MNKSKFTCGHLARQRYKTLGWLKGVVVTLCLLTLPVQAGVQVSNIRAAQRVGTDLVDIRYDLVKVGTGPSGITDNITFPIMLTISDGGTPVSSVSATGAVGANQSPGLNKLIVWNAAADWSTYNGSTNMSFTVGVSATATLPSGGDASAIGWQVINTRWVRNFYPDGSVTMSDRDTGLMWLFDTDASYNRNWLGAYTYCRDLSYAGKTDWGLPTRDQLRAVYSQKTVFADVLAAKYWSNTLYLFPPAGEVYYWSVHMGDGSESSVSEFASQAVWPMRSAQ